MGNLEQEMLGEEEVEEELEEEIVEEVDEEVISITINLSSTGKYSYNATDDVSPMVLLGLINYTQHAIITSQLVRKPSKEDADE